MIIESKRKVQFLLVNKKDSTERLGLFELGGGQGGTKVLNHRKALT